jgi:hypothetical protein
LRNVNACAGAPRQARLLERAHRVLREHLVEQVVRRTRRHYDRIVLFALDAAEKLKTRERTERRRCTSRIRF